MNTPSRRMPQATPVKIGPFKRALGWAILLNLVGLLAYLLWQAWQRSVFLGGALALFFAAALLSPYVEKRRLRKLAAGRAGESLCTFARAFDRRQVDTWVIRAVHEEVGRSLAHPAFPLRPEDDIGKTLNIDEDELDWEIAAAIAQRTGRSLEGVEANPYYGKVRAAGDLVMFFNAQPAQAKADPRQG